MKKSELRYESIGQYKENAVFFIPIDKIRVAEKQAQKISKDKVERHKQYLLKNDSDLLPIDALELEDGTFVIDGNGRHRFFAYKELGYMSMPLNIKNRKGFRPTKIEKGQRVV